MHTHTLASRAYTPTDIIHSGKGEDDDEVTDAVMTSEFRSTYETDADGWTQ